MVKYIDKSLALVGGYVYDKCVSKYPEMSAVSPPLGVCQPEILSSYPGRGDCNLFV